MNRYRNLTQAEILLFLTRTIITDYCSVGESKSLHYFVKWENDLRRLALILEDQGKIINVVLLTGATVL